VGFATRAEYAKRIERLAHQIAGKGADATMLELARAAAQAEFDLAHIRRTRVALINRMLVFGEFEIPNPLGTWRQMKRALTLMDRGLPGDPTVPTPPELPSSEPERTAEALRGALPELLKLDRYEWRAMARRDRASRQIAARKKLMHNQ
jgi:hypothetical protein